MLRVLLIGFFALSISAYKPIEFDTKVEWITWEEAIAKHKTTPKKLLIDIYTNWCGWCKVMDRETYSNPTIAKYIRENFYPVKFNAEQKAPIVFNGTTFEYVSSGRSGVHQLAAALTNNKLSYPTTVFMNEELRIIQSVPGYLKPERMDPLLKYMGDGFYKTTTWEAFAKNYKSSF